MYRSTLLWFDQTPAPSFPCPACCLQISIPIDTCGGDRTRRRGDLTSACHCHPSPRPPRPLPRLTPTTARAISKTATVHRKRGGARMRCCPSAGNSFLPKRRGCGGGGRSLHFVHHRFVPAHVRAAISCRLSLHVLGVAFPFLSDRRSGGWLVRLRARCGRGEEPRRGWGHAVRIGCSAHVRLRARAAACVGGARSLSSGQWCGVVWCGGELKLAMVSDAVGEEDTAPGSLLSYCACTCRHPAARAVKTEMKGGSEMMDPWRLGAGETAE